MALRGLIVALLVGPAAPALAAAAPEEPSVLRGAAQVVGGPLVEFPKTVLDATFTGPPLVGTLVGVAAGIAKGLQTSVAGVIEIAAGVKRWGASR
jgi:hypothetical protein